MSAHPDLTLPLHPSSVDGADAITPQGPWAIEAIEPTDLLALWPRSAGDQPPSLEAALDALQRHFGERPAVIKRDLPRDDPRILWSAAIEVPSGRNVLLWAEPMREMSAEHIAHLKIEGVKWVIGVEAILDARDPLGDFLPLLKMLARGIPDSPAILNVNTEVWHVRQELDETIFADDEIGPGRSILWIVHAISGSADPQSTVWAYTRGLHRCGLPELEFLDVPINWGRHAVSILSTIAELAVEQGLPEPGEPWEIGHDLEVTVQPWQVAAAGVSPQVLGSAALREGHDGQPRTGAHATICAVRPLNGRWVWPARVVERLDGEEAFALYQSRHATRRQEKLAQATWDDLTRAFFALKGDAGKTAQGHRTKAAAADVESLFLMKAGFERPGLDLQGSPPDREHLWFEILAMEGSRVRGRLMHQSMLVPQLRVNEVRWIERARLSDWRVSIPRLQATFGPEHVKPMRQAIFALKSMP